MRRRVLIIDDAPEIRSTLSRILRHHDVSTAAGGPEALQLLRSGRRYDVILCDLSMPQMSGMALHGAVTRERPEQAAHFIFLTGGATTARRIAFLGTPGIRVLLKPVSPAVLRGAVADVPPFATGETCLTSPA